MSEYVSMHLSEVETVTHLRVGAPPGMTPGAPGYEAERRFFMAALPEADLVYREGPITWILEFGVWRPQTKLGQLQLYGVLLNETPGFLDIDPELIKLKIVVGREEPMVDRMAAIQGIETEVFTRTWLEDILAKKGAAQ